MTTFGRDVVNVLAVAFAYAAFRGSARVTPSDLLFGVADVPGPCARLLLRYGVSSRSLAHDLQPDQIALTPDSRVLLSLTARSIVDHAYREAARRQRTQVSTAHLAFAILVGEGEEALRLLRSAGVDAMSLKQIERALPL